MLEPQRSDHVTINITDTIDVQPALSFVQTSLTQHGMFKGESDEFWRTKILQEPFFTDHPKLQVSSWDRYETYKEFHSKSTELVRKFAELAQKSSTTHEEWVVLFANVVRRGCEKFIPKFAGIITDYSERFNENSSSDNTFLLIATRQGHTHLVKFFLDQDVPVDQIGNGYIEWLKGRDFPYQAGNTPLCNAGQGGHLECLRLLLDKGANINFAPKNGHGTPLHQAAAFGHLKCFKELIDRGANTSIVDGNGMTALDLAKKINREEWRQYLSDKFNITVSPVFYESCTLA